MALTLPTLADLDLLTESVDVECKLAQGKDGKGELPRDFWPTYSAFANTRGGIVLLGIQEEPRHRFRVAGLSNIEKIRTDLFNTLNNPSKVSTNLLGDSDVRTKELAGKQILEIHIPAASRKQKPVFINGQPLTGTYRRLHDGDRRSDEESVRRMFAEQVEDSRDERILPDFNLDDIDLASLRIYRQMLTDRKPSHPALDHEGIDFLRQIGGWRKDRANGSEGLTLAGLLMFGRWLSIQEAVPHYFVDYQERPQAKTELRWIDRVVPDGTWSGNLFDFYRLTYRKLIADMKVPFSLKEGQRQDDTPVHEALREALVNTLVHADYTGRVSVLVVKRPDMLGFRNPGNLRLPLEQVLQGGISDCRNRLIHQMFLLIGLGERGGSGVPKIYSGWRSQQWRPPLLYDKEEPDQTRLELRMIDLLPVGVTAHLRKRFGAQFDALEHTARLILATAAIEQVVSHGRLLEICDTHAHDLSQLLARLVRDKFLVPDGRSRGVIYHLPGEKLPTPEQVFAESQQSSEHYTDTSEHYTDTSEHKTEPDPQRNSDGCLLSDHFDAPLIDTLETLSPKLLQTLQALAQEPRQRGRMPRAQMQEVIRDLCCNHYLTLNVLASLLNRSPDALRQQYLNGMVKNKTMRLAFPSKPTHERQAYKAHGKK